MAKRYGKLPSEIAKGSMEDYNLDTLAAQRGIMFENEQAKKQNRASKRRNR